MIRCDVNRFQPSQSQKKTIKQVLNHIRGPDKDSKSNQKRDAKNTSKSLNDYLADATNLTVRTVKVDFENRDFMQTFRESFQVYQKYQMKIHGDDQEDCDVETFTGFICDSPLIPSTDGNVSYGSYHQHYLVDGKIVIVGVVDILPGCVSSVYLYYDPDWWEQKPNLSPGIATLFLIRI